MFGFRSGFILHFASKTSGIPCHSVIPAQLLAFAGTWIDLRLRHLWKMSFCEDGHSPRIVIVVKPKQSQKAPSSMFVTLAGMVTDVSPRQPANAQVLMFFTLVGIVNVTRPLHP